MKSKKAALTISVLLVVCLTCIFNVFAHSGRTDASGGHRDNKNASGLGYYHYHCGGYPAHLHSNGVCPYKKKTSSSSKSTSSSSSTKKTYTDGYNTGYKKGYDEGYDKGYNEGHKKGYNKGYNKGYDEGYNERLIIIVVASLSSILIITICVSIVKFKKKRRKE